MIFAAINYIHTCTFKKKKEFTLIVFLRSVVEFHCPVSLHLHRETNPEIIGHTKIINTM